MTPGRAFLAAAALFAAAAAVGAPRLDAPVLSDRRGGAHKTSFVTSTPKVYLTARVLGAPAGTKVKSVWVAEKTAAAPANYVIDSFELTLGALKDPRVDFAMAKPTKGWPVGAYRIDLLVNGKKSTDLRFHVK